MERYCSSYYDRHGLYNDGFPCPGQTYCCQKSDGQKQCCSENEIINEEQKMSEKHQKTIFQPTSTILSHISESTNFYRDLKNLPFRINNINNRNNENQNNNFQENIQNRIGSSNNDLNKQYLHNSNPNVSSISFLMSNSALVLGICLAFGILVILTSLFLACLFRYCSKNKDTSSSQKNQRNNHKSSKNSTQKHTKNSSVYSRNSSSSGSSNGTGSTSTSPKGNQITCCEDGEDLDECHNILTIDPNYHHNRSNLGSLSHQAGPNLMLSNRSSNLNDYLLRANNQNLNKDNVNSIYSSGPSHYMTNAMSSGSSSVCTSLLLNNLNNINSANTTQSFVFNNQLPENPNSNQNIIINDLYTEKDENEEDDDSENETDQGDFISSTTSNLEFLKNHSLFNSQPMNYYPTLGLSSALSKLTPNLENHTLNNHYHFNQIHSNSNIQPPLYSDTKKGLSTSIASNSTSGLVGDFRFSTFLPATASSSSTNTTIYGKNNDLI